MQPIDLQPLHSEEPRPGRSRPIAHARLLPVLILLGLASLAIAAAGVVAYLSLAEDRTPLPAPALSWPRTPHVPTDPALITAADPAQLAPLSAANAEARNAAIPVANLPNPAAAALRISSADPVSFARGLECMTAAIYYEAATEPVDGQRAVAQVVLNRVRHPIFPHTICGVVYQGAERATGCQFSFTCDGSLARRPLPRLWLQARQVALAALSGSVYAPVGWATHYHADYVLPYWAPTLTKLAVIGRHIFYRWPGGGGSPRGFSARYAGAEPDITALVTLATAAARARALSAPVPASSDAAAMVPPPATERPVLDADGPARVDRQAMPVAPLSSRWVVGDSPPTPARAAPLPTSKPSPRPSPSPQS